MSANRRNSLPARGDRDAPRALPRSPVANSSPLRPGLPSAARPSPPPSYSLRWDSPIQYVRGVGPRRAGDLATLGIHTVGDVLEYFPFRHEIELGEIEIADLRPGAIATVRGEVLSVSRRWTNLKAEITDGSAFCTLRWFNNPNIGSGLMTGAIVIATGKVQAFNDELEIVQPRLQIFPPDALTPLPAGGARRVGVYRGNERVKSLAIRRVAQAVLAQGRLPVEDALPPALIRKHKLPSRESALRQMHAPENDAALAAARRRLAYEELLLMELAMAIRRRRHVALLKGRKLFVTEAVDRRIRARFPFPLTAAQDRAVREIARDLESGRPMTRLLQGDVGSGKTVVALYMCLAAIANGRQAAIMAPTEILAAQHFARIEQYLADSRVRRVLLRGGLGKRERADALAKIERGELDLIVGTQALLEKDVAFHDLAAVVVDEQHKFGVLQRANLRTKGPMPHYLLMTATPIPRTLAMTVFGDLDVSVLDGMPPGRGKIVTKLVFPGQWKTVMEYVRDRLARGEQAYVVCPLIGDEDARAAETQAVETGAGEAGGTGPAAPAAGRVSAVELHARLTRGPWRELNVGLLHGGMKSAEKDALIGAFARGELHALVATTVVEVGVDVANATIMVIENADRFGLSQLHQLRGRVGRGSKDSLCVLIARSRSEKSRQRLAVMIETTDGFRIAEADLRLRGPGELFGTRQHGLPELRVASLVDDFELLEQARRDAFDIVAGDPNLAAPEHRNLLPALRKMFAGKLALIDAG
ncbi:MAG: ATP-dependent DNA helicase RecG [Phycisphaerae bacterium]